MALSVAVTESSGGYRTTCGSSFWPLDIKKKEQQLSLSSNCSCNGGISVSGGGQDQCGKQRAEGSIRKVMYLNRWIQN